MPRPQDRSHWADWTTVCPIHGEFNGIICQACHEPEKLRIERESAELRYARTPDFMRRQRAALLAESNGEHV